MIGHHGGMEGNAGPYCGHCGEPDDGHPGCRAALVLEPPRFCTVCRRRMVVQVVPSGWTATCSQHGTISASQGDSTPAR